jgi:hypothetical protein
MHRPVSSLAKLFFTSVTSCALLGSSSLAPAQNSEGSAQPNNGLELRINRIDEGQSGGPKFAVELTNKAEADFVLNLGDVIGDKQILNLVLTISDERGESHKLMDSREPAVIAGSAYPMVVPLCVGCTFSFPVDFRRYHITDGAMLNPGFYSIVARFVGTPVNDRSIEVQPNWNGVVTSNRLRFKIQ